MEVGYVIVAGGEGEGGVTAFSGERISLLGSGALAPGTPVKLRVMARQRTEYLEGKSLGSRRDPRGEYSTDIRLCNLRRPQRIWLKEACAESD